MADDDEGLDVGTSFPGGSFLGYCYRTRTVTITAVCPPLRPFSLYIPPKFSVLEILVRKMKWVPLKLLPKSLKKSGIDDSDFSTPPSRGKSTSIRSSSKSKKKKYGLGQESIDVSCGGDVVGAAVEGERNRRKNSGGNGLTSSRRHKG
ncbi:hypothetical protein Ancab_028375 [Ancistrocladus abbreviatus]